MRDNRRGKTAGIAVGACLILAAFLIPRAPAPAPAAEDPAAAYRAAEALHREAAGAPDGARAARLGEARDAYRAFLRAHPHEARWSAEAAFGEASIFLALGDTPAGLASLARIETDFPGERWTRLRAMKTRADLTGDTVLRARIFAEYGGENEPPTVRMVVRALRR